MNIMKEMKADGVGMAHAGIAWCTRYTMVLMLAAHAFVGCTSKDIDTGIYDNEPLDRSYVYIEIVNTTEYDILDITGVHIVKPKSGPIIKKGESKWIRMRRNAPEAICWCLQQKCLAGGHWSKMRIYSKSEGRAYDYWPWKMTDDKGNIRPSSPVFKYNMSLYLIQEGRQFYLTNIEP